MSVHVIAYDVGTTGLKACLFRITDQARITHIASTVEGYPLHALGGGALEQDPDDWWQAMAKTTRHLLEETGTAKEDIAAVSFCSQMQNVILVDETGKPLRPCISWMDTRANEQFHEAMQKGLAIEGLNVLKLLKFLKITGAGALGSKDAIYKYLWIRDNEPDIFAKAYKWLDAKEYLTCRATGFMKASRDVAGSTFLYDAKKDCWSEPLCRMMGIQMRHLPELCSSTDVVGPLLPGPAEALGLAPGTKVFSGGSDVSLCQIGSGCVEEGDVSVYSGTSGWVETTVGKLHTDVGNLIGTLVGADPTVYNYVAEIDTAGKCMEWVKDRIDQQGMDYDQMMDYIRQTPAGSNGVIFSPWMHGNRCPFEDANARGLFFNLDIDNRGSDLIKAVIEGVCMHFRWLLEATEKSFPTKPVVRFTGGSANSRQIAQMLADVLGRQVETVENTRMVGVMGAVGLVAVGMGLLQDIKELKHVIAVRDTYTPIPENQAVYNHIFPVFKDLYKNNKKAYAVLNGCKSSPVQQKVGANHG